MARLIILFLSLIVALIVSACLTAAVAHAQVLNYELRPDVRRALASKQKLSSRASQKGGARTARLNERPMRNQGGAISQDAEKKARVVVSAQNIPATVPIAPGTSLNRILHTSQLSLSSTTGTNEQFFDRNLDLIADERTTFDFTNGSFDIAIGRSGSRYEVFPATIGDRLIGALVVALDTNGDFVADQSATYDLETDFSLPSAVAVVAGLAKDGREFVVVSSSGYYNSEDPNDPNNEPSPGVVLLVRDPLTGGFDQTLSRELVKVGDNQLFNANGLALMPNNEVLIADFQSNELRIVRDTNRDGLPDTLDNTPYYSYRFSDDAPLDVAANSRGVVFSHSVGNSTLMLVIYDDNGDGRADRDEVVVEGLSIDNNLILHGLTIDQKGNVYVIEDAVSSSDGDGGNGGIARIDAFPDPNLDGFLKDGSLFAEADFDDLGLSGLGFAASPPSRKMMRNTWRKTDAGGDQPVIGAREETVSPLPTGVPILVLNSSALTNANLPKTPAKCVQRTKNKGQESKNDTQRGDKPDVKNLKLPARASKPSFGSSLGFCDQIK